LTESQSATLAVLRALLAGPTEPGLQALLPSGLEINSARVEAGICYADFSELLLTGIPESEEEQLLVLESVVESLQSLGYIQAVQFLVEGESLSRYGYVDLSQPLS
jgi:spore germination protein GerM